MNYKFEFTYEKVPAHSGIGKVRITTVQILRKLPGAEDYLGYLTSEVRQSERDQDNKEKARKAAITDAINPKVSMGYSYQVSKEERTEIWAAYFARKLKKPDNVKRMDLTEFRETGYLQEVNRGFFHPHGLALEMSIDNGQISISGIWDYRDDPEGIIFVDGVIKKEKIDTVAAELESHREARTKLLGSVIQPFNENSTESAS